MELYYCLCIVDRERAGQLTDILKDLSISLCLQNLGFGTATHEHLSLYDLEETEKSVVTAVATKTSLKALIKAAKRKLFIDIPGNGVIAAIPIKSTDSRNTLEMLTDGQVIEGKVPDMNFDHEMIVVILNEGYSDVVMEAARTAGATGGTVFHAKGTGKAPSPLFRGVSLADEKDIIYILASKEKKSGIMKSINTHCGVGTKFGAVSFSLPVSEVAGIRAFDEENGSDNSET